MNHTQTVFTRRVVLSMVFLVLLMGMFAAVPVVNAVAQTAEEAGSAITPEQADVAKFGFLAAAAAFGFGAIGAGIGIAHVGAAAMGAISEKPEVAGQALIFIALAEGLVVFGFITALIILGRI
jgi:V/A-type H+/Na+-transporting ATPase subunit K